MLYPFLVLGVLVLGLASSIGGIIHLSKQNALLKERVLHTLDQLQEQNRQIKELELNTKNYLEQHRPASTKAIQDRYSHTKTAKELHTCQEQLTHVENLLQIFKSQTDALKVNPWKTPKMWPLSLS